MQKLVISLPARRSLSYSHVRLSGHNKWSKIKERKGANDAQKSVIFGKASRDITMAVRAGGSADPTKNLQLAAVLKRAREMDVPKENIEKALAKASQGREQEGFGFIYEALAFSSVGLIIECQTDNSNRTIHNLRAILKDHDARTTPVKFMFQRQGRITMVSKKSLIGQEKEHAIDKLISIGLDNGATDLEIVKAKDDYPTFQFICDPNHLQELTSLMMEHCNDLWTVQEADLRYVPLESHPELSPEVKSSLKALLEELEANEDVLRVWTNVLN